jgi:hypothetical protein
MSLLEIVDRQIELAIGSKIDEYNINEYHTYILSQLVWGKYISLEEKYITKNLINSIKNKISERFLKVMTKVLEDDYLTIYSPVDFVISYQEMSDIKVMQMAELTLLTEAALKLNEKGEVPYEVTILNSDKLIKIFIITSIIETMYMILSNEGFSPVSDHFFILPVVVGDSKSNRKKNPSVNVFMNNLSYYESSDSHMSKENKIKYGKKPIIYFKIYVRPNFLAYFLRKNDNNLVAKYTELNNMMKNIENNKLISEIANDQSKG